MKPIVFFCTTLGITVIAAGLGTATWTGAPTAVAASTYTSPDAVRPASDAAATDAGDPNDRNVVFDPVGDWRDAHGQGTTAADSIDILTADVSLAGESAAHYAGYWVVSMELADLPQPTDGAPTRYAAHLDFDRDGRPDIDVSASSNNRQRWQVDVEKINGHTRRPLVFDSTDVFAVIHSATVKIWLNPHALQRRDLKPPFNWSVSAQQSLPNGDLVDPEFAGDYPHAPTQIVTMDDAHGTYPFYPGDGDRRPPRTYIVVNKVPVVDRRCALLVGDDSHGIGPKDTQDFEQKLLQFPEWQAPRGLIRSQRVGASNKTIARDIAGLSGQGCRQLLFFYSGHGGNKKGDRKPFDEVGAIQVDEYLSIRNRSNRLDKQIQNDQRVYDDELAGWLMNWQTSNRFTVAIPTASELGQAQDVPPPILVILQACYSGGFVGGEFDLDGQLFSYDILMGSQENQRCYGIQPNGVATNSFFVANLLPAMDIAGNDRRITGLDLFMAAGAATTRDARTRCTRRGGCAQNPTRSAKDEFVLHEP